MHTPTTAPRRLDVPGTSRGESGADVRLADRIRAEFMEMPGLRLTPAQAARVLGTDTTRSKRLLEELLGDGFLVREGDAFRRRDTSSRWAGGHEAGPTTAVRRAHRQQASGPGRHALDDVLETIAVELPCLVCRDSYRVSLRKIRISQKMVDTGCTARHFADCPPAALAHLLDPATLAELDEVVKRIEAEADGAGGRLVHPDADGPA